jgi:hypothetical protein
MYRPCGLVTLPGSTRTSLCGGNRNAGEFDARAARFPHHKVYLGALARPFRRELNYCVGPCRDARVQGVKCVAVDNPERKMV